MKIGDLIRQARMPGGICIFLGEETVDETRYVDVGHDPDALKELYYHVLHPTEGLLFEPSYYYEEISFSANRQFSKI